MNEDENQNVNENEDIDGIKKKNEIKMSRK